VGVVVKLHLFAGSVVVRIPLRRDHPGSPSITEASHLNQDHWVSGSKT